MRLFLRHITAISNNHLQGVSLYQGVSEMQLNPLSIFIACYMFRLLEKLHQAVRNIHEER
jgi:hypothetical protein